MGQDWIVRPLRLRSNQKIILEDGVVISAKKGEFRGTNDSLFVARDVENLIIQGLQGHHSYAQRRLCGTALYQR